MTVNYTPLLGLAQPVTGTESGTWGDTINASLTALVESSIAGVATASVASGNWTLSTTGSGAANEQRMAILIPTGSPGVSRNIIAPSQSKIYIVINQSNASVVLKGAATTGVTIASGKTTMVAWNGSDFVELTPNTIAGILPVVNGGTGTSTPALVAGTNISITGTWPNQTITGPVSTGASIKPSLLLDFANSKTLDPRITFTRASTATYTGYDGLIKTAASGAPRFDFNPTTGESLGLLIEEQRTNLLTYSEQFDNAAWTKSNATVTANATTAPDGTVTADKLVEDTATTVPHYTGQNCSLSLSTVYTGTYYVKAGERTRCVITTGGDTWLSAGVFIDLTNGSVISYTGTASSTTVSVSVAGNGWYKCSLTATTGASGSGGRNFLVMPVLSGTTSSYTGDGTSGIYIWGAQLEAGAFPTSYIPTTSAQATRAADNAVMTGTNFSSWYRQDEGSFLAKADFIGVSSVSQSVFSAADDSGNRQILYRTTGKNKTYQIDNIGTQAALSGSVLENGVMFCGAAAYKVNDISVSFDGNTPLTDTLATIPAPNKLYIGDYIGIRTLNGHISKLAYYPKRLSNAELQSITTV